MERSYGNTDQLSVDVTVRLLDAHCASLLTWAGITVAVQILDYFSVGQWFLPGEVTNSNASIFQWSTLLTIANLVIIVSYVFLNLHAVLTGSSQTAHSGTSTDSGSPVRSKVIITGILVISLAIAYAGIFVVNSPVVLEIFKSRTNAGIAALTVILCFRGVISGYATLLVACLMSLHTGALVAVFFLTTYAAQSGLWWGSTLRLLAAQNHNATHFKQGA
ncbi:uncharacterized protein LOC129585329 [Paramacrobiotus metropolitanus]|uniref:uncharacterized protein LOC129585329 n=1 Tax=Paramacrobiotus metropolitanus TaxID=2943436 RepID=UPI00244619BD|nr:uncharacterized protein LOC129585329 [Paramacrobiotus metropolitanus]